VNETFPEGTAPSPDPFDPDLESSLPGPVTSNYHASPEFRLWQLIMQHVPKASHRVEMQIALDQIERRSRPRETAQDRAPVLAQALRS
jgi:hypothetical protein